MQPNDYATKDDVARLETRITGLEGLLNEVLGLLRGMAVPGSQPPTKRQVDPAYLPGGVEWMKMAPEEEQKEYRRKLMKQRRQQHGPPPRKNS